MNCRGATILDYITSRIYPFHSRLSDVVGHQKIHKCEKYECKKLST